MRELKLGEVSKTGAIFIGNCFVSHRVVKRAPFSCRLARNTKDWVVLDKDGRLYDYGMAKEAAEAKVEELNTLAAIAIMVSKP